MMKWQRTLTRPETSGKATRFVTVLLVAFFLFSKGLLAATVHDELIEGAKREREVEVYATLGLEDAAALVAKFEAKYPFLKVKLTRADSEKLLTRVLLESRARQRFADVIQTVAFSMHAFVKKGILASYVPSEDRFYDKEFKGQTFWTAAYVNPYVVAYNTKMAPRDRLPKSYSDLLHPVWNGKMLMEGTKADWFAGMLQIMGRQEGLQYMRSLAKQNVMLRAGHTLIAQLVAAGEALLDVNITLSSANRLKQKGAPIDWLAPGPIPGIMIGIGTVTNPPHPNAAKLFLDFVLSQEGQKVLEKFDRVSARSDLSGEQGGKYKPFKLVPVNPALGENLNEYAEVLRQIFGN